MTFTTNGIANALVKVKVNKAAIQLAKEHPNMSAFKLKFLFATIWSLPIPGTLAGNIFAHSDYTDEQIINKLARHV